jgi:ribonuclease P/MRP protein subunit RPP1
VAIRPLKDKIFQACCQTLDIDLISLDVTKRFPFAVKTAMVQQAIARGIHFEISIGSALKDPNIRRHMLSNALHLVRVTKGRNIIITSEAQRAIDLRAPYDLINLGVLFGLNQAEAKLCIAKHCNSMLLHGATRKTAKGVIGLQKVADLAPSEVWKLPTVIPEHKTDDINNNNTNAPPSTGNAVSTDVEMRDEDTERASRRNSKNTKKRKHSK